MSHRLISLAILLAVGTGWARAPEPVAVEEAEPASAETPGMSTGLNLKYGEALSSAAERSIQDEISVDLIDLEALREAIETAMPRETVRLGLDACIQIALAQNQDIIIAGYEPQKTEADIFSARGEFDAAWQTQGNYLRSSASASQEVFAFAGISSIENYQTTINSAVAGKLHYGTQYAVAFDLNKSESTYGRFIEEFDARMTLTLTQPLIRAFGQKVNTVRIKQARNANQIAHAQLKLAVMNTIAEVVKAYWDLVGAVENVKVRSESLANAERLLRINETRREIGMGADLEVLQAKAGVATRQGDLVSARAAVENAADRLKQLLDLREGDAFSKISIIPIDRPNPKALSEFDPTEADRNRDLSIERALQHRPEIQMAELQIENAELEEMRTRNDMMPQFDLTGTYTQGGRDHQLRQTLEGIQDKQEKFYSYGFQASIPIRNRAARGQYQRAKLTRREMEQRLQQTRQNLMLNVHLAARNVLTNQILVESNRQARGLQEANVVAEEKRQRLGVTTIWQVLQVQEDLTAAQTLEVQAQTAYEKALVDLRLAEGMLMETFGIEFEAPEADKPVGFFNSITPRWE